MEASDGFTMVESSQSTGQTAFVGGLDYSGDSGFREGNPGLITDGTTWDQVITKENPATRGDGDGVRVTRSAAARLQADSNTIPGSGKNVPRGGGAGGGGSAVPQVLPSGSGQGGGGDTSHTSSSGTNPSTSGGDGRNRNGHDAHPGRAIGAGGPGSGGPTASAGAAALLAKMFREPLKDPVPSGVQFLPCDTEEVRSEREGKGATYSPVMWADPLIPLNITVGSTSSSIDRLPAIGVSVSNKLDMHEPVLTQQGMLLKTVIDTEASPTLLRSMMPIKGMKDMSALLCLLEASRRSGVQAMTDEAPLIRLGLLMHCLAPEEWSSYSTSCVQNMVANGYADVSKAKKVWTKAPAQSTRTQIGIESGASNIYWRTLAQYARLISGSALAGDFLHDSAKVEVPVSDVKFIPVKMSWRGQSWLGPYILAHTTTKWWNHSVQVEIPVKIHDLKTSTNTAKITCMPKAATVYVPGTFKYICLVIVDVVEASFPITENFYIGNSHMATYAGNFDFGKIGHKIIGRNIDNPARAATMVDCMAAWKVMCKSLLSHVDPGAIEVRLAVLATSRFAGFSVWTDEAKPKKKKSAQEQCVSLMSDLGLDEDDDPGGLTEWLQLLSDVGQAHPDDEHEDNDLTPADRVSLVKAIINLKFGNVGDDDEEKDHISGVTCMDPKTDITIGDHTIPDWFTSYATTKDMPDRVKYYTWWRVDPLHNFSLALVSCADGSKPALEKFESGEMQYEVSEATDMVRIMSYADVYLDNSACSGAISKICVLPIRDNLPSGEGEN